MRKYFVKQLARKFDPCIQGVTVWPYHHLAIAYTNLISTRIKHTRRPRFFPLPYSLTSFLSSSLWYIFFYSLIFLSVPPYHTLLSTVWKTTRALSRGFNQLTSQIDVPHIKNKHSSLGDNILARDTSFNGSVLNWKRFGNERGGIKSREIDRAARHDKKKKKKKAFTWVILFKVGFMICLVKDISSFFFCECIHS